jgi:hypothetical protein
MHAFRYPRGLDWVWLATDGEGRVAAFVTAGEAPVPALALEVQFPDSAHLEAAFAALPERSATRTFGAPGDLGAYIELAERGLFVYDWQDAHRPVREETGAYELVAAPTTPSRAAELPPLLRVAALSMRLPKLRFEQTPLVDVRRHAACVGPH